jgi:MFS family permease
MASDERRSGIALAGVFALRMLGLFLVLPVLSVYALELPSGRNLALVGLALGAYGLTQAFLQIAYGVASDRFGRKPVIIFGLVLFALGSLVAALSNDIHGIIAGRALQGAGAVSAAVTALAADLTREQHLTKVMAMIGSSIGLVFAFSMVAAPLLFAAIGMPGIFMLTGFLALASIVVVLRSIPTAPAIPRQPGWSGFRTVLGNRALLRMNGGVFVLHFIQTAMWVLLPQLLVRSGGLPVDEHWKVYLPAVLLSFVVMVPAIIAAERHGLLRQVFIAAIVLLVCVQFGFALAGADVLVLALWLTLFFVAFNVLEAVQPSLISRLAPAYAKGAALGIYNTMQSVGLFLGGLVGGALSAWAGSFAVWMLCALFGGLWLVLSLGLPEPLTRDDLV